MDKIHISIAILLICMILMLILIRLYIVWKRTQAIGMPSILDLSKEAKSALFFEDLSKMDMSYHKRKDIFYNAHDDSIADYGYCRPYDEEAIMHQLVLDYEPIIFEYEREEWVIAFWKGQYRMSSGFEVGIYKKVVDSFQIPDIYTGPFYMNVKNQPKFNLDVTLYRNGRKIIQRKSDYGYLNGFRLGSFSYPEELTMKILITFPTQLMCNAFIQGLIRIGYEPSEYDVYANVIMIRYNYPHTPAPLTNTSVMIYLKQKTNRRLCASYQYLTSNIKKMEDRFHLLKQYNPHIYEQMLQIGRKKSLYESYEALKPYLPLTSDVNND